MKRIFKIICVLCMMYILGLSSYIENVKEFSLVEVSIKCAICFVVLFVSASKAGLFDEH